MLRTGARIVLGAFFIFAGVLHFINPQTYVGMMPPYLPFHLELVYLSGVFEIAGGLGVFHPKTQRLAGLGLIALLVAVFPANLHMAIHQVQIEGLPGSPFALWARLPFQLVFIAWAWWATQPSKA